jgi:geranylgeranyl reductase family protein
MKADVVIIGAGPAGSIAAQHLAAAGVQVVLLERATFPRDKSCGDGITTKGLHILNQVGLGEWASRFLAPEIGRMSSPDGQTLDMRLKTDDYCYGRTIPRRLLDAQLARVATEAGARLLEGTRAWMVERSNGAKPLVTAGKLSVAAEMVILADGSHAPVTRRLGLAQWPPEIFAIRQYLAGDTGPAERLEIHFQRSLLPGYAWVFPMGEGRVNVGIGTYTRRVRRGEVPLREMLSRFAADPTVTKERLAKAEPVGPMRSHPLRTRLDATRTHAERILVTGDAAGLVSPLSGEGIGPAMESGLLAATHVQSSFETGDFSASALSAYSRALQSRYGPDQRAARVLRLLLSAPGLLNRVFSRLRQDKELALLVGFVIIGHKSPRLALRPTTLVRLLA